MVGKEGLEPSSLAATDFKSVAYTSSATRPGGAYEIRTRVKGFADLCLTPRPTRPKEPLNYTRFTSYLLKSLSNNGIV